jgi:hypothetical protein
MCIANVKVAPVQPIGPDEPRLQMRALKRLDGTWEFASAQFDSKGNLENVDTAFIGFQPKATGFYELFRNAFDFLNSTSLKSDLIEVE